MQLTKFPKTNPQYDINKRQVDEVLQPPATKKPDDKNTGIRIYPYLSTGLCDNLIYQNVLLDKCITTLAEDTILNDITILKKDNEDNNDLLNEEIISFWENNQDELKKQAIDIYSYGFGASEVIYNTKGKPAKIYQIPADTLHILKETKPNNNGESTEYYYAVQSVTGQTDVKMRLYNEEYPVGDDDLPVCFWIGGGRKSNYYDYPIWLSAFNHISASVSLDLLDAQKLADGNLISGILTIIRPPALVNETSKDIDDTLEEKMHNKGAGIFTLELTTLNPNIPLNVEYIKISEDNYQYLTELGSKADSKTLAIFKIPKARLLIDDTTESMNSNKTNTLYQIYTIELSNQQRLFENSINTFNRLLLDFNGRINIKTPVFVNEEDVQADSVIKLFNSGLITLGQAVNKISKIYPEYELETGLDETNPIFNERYYNGNPLGFANKTLDNPVTELGDFVDYFKLP